MEDRQILALYQERDERAIAETDSKYGSYCYMVAKKILDIHEDAEECVNDTWMRAWETIPPQVPEVFRIFLAKITRNLALDTYRANTAKKRGNGEFTAVLDELEEVIAGGEQPEEALESKELSETIKSFVDTLPKRDGDIFLRRYFYMDSTREIAERYAMKEANVLTILSRTRKILKDRLIKEGYVL